MPSPSSLWSVPPIWAGQTAFVLGGGPSAAAQVGSLRGKNVIAINSAWTSLPSSQFLFFHDSRWWIQFGAAVKAEYKGQIVTPAEDADDRRFLRVKKVDPPRTKRLHRLTPPPFDMVETTARRDSVVMRRTSLTGAIHLAGLLGATTAVLIGADGRLGKNGVRHHHGVSYPWPVQVDSFAAWAAELTKMAPEFERIGLKVVNASPGSAFKAFPLVRLEDYL